MKLAWETITLIVATVVSWGNPVAAQFDPEFVGDVAIEIREVALESSVELQNYVISDVPVGSRAFFVYELNRICDKSEAIAHLSNMDQDDINTETVEILALEIRQTLDAMFDRAIQLDHPDLSEIVNELTTLTDELIYALE